MRLRVIISSLFIGIVFFSSAQKQNFSKLWKDPVQIADELYDDRLYDAALSFYLEEALNQNIFTDAGTVTNPALALKIAESYYRLRKLEQAATYYEYVIEDEPDSVEAAYLLRYGESLLYSEKIDQAKKWFNAYYQRTNDPLGKERFRGTVIYKELMASLKPTTIKSSVFNTTNSYIAPKLLDGKLYFSGPIQQNVWMNQQYLQGDMELYQLIKRDTNGLYPVKLPESFYNVGSPVQTKDVILFTANSRKDPRLLLYEGRVNDQGLWTDFKVSTLNDSVGSIHSIAMDTVSQTLYFSADFEGGFGGFDLYTAVKDSMEWSAPENMGPFINTAANELYPFFGYGHFTFSSNGHPGLGGYDLFEFENDEVVNLAFPLNSSKDDLGIFFADAYNGYFFSNRPGGEGKDDIYEFTQTDNPEIAFELLLTRKINGAMLSEAQVGLTSFKGDHKISLQTNEEGELKTKLHTRTNYLLTIEKEGYITLKDTMEVLLETVKTTYELDELHSFQALVFSEESNAAIGNPTVFVENFSTQRRSEVSGNSTGFFEIREPANSHVSILITKEGYSFISDTIYFDQKESTQTYTMKKVKPAGSLTLKDLLYELDQYKLQDDYVPVLDSIANSLKKFRNLRIIVESHTDSRGESEYNLQLSQLRAESVKEYLVEQGVEITRIGAVGKGEEDLLNECSDGVKCSDEQHGVNRRTEIKLFRSR